MDIKKFAKQELERAKKKLKKRGGLEITARAYDSNGVLSLTPQLSRPTINASNRYNSSKMLVSWVALWSL